METMNESLTDFEFSGEDGAWNNSACFEQQAMDYLPATESDMTQSEASAGRLDGGGSLGNLGGSATLSPPERAEFRNSHQGLQMSGDLESSLQDVAVGFPESSSPDTGDVVLTVQSQEESEPPSSSAGMFTRRGYLRSAQDEELKRQYREEAAASQQPAQSQATDSHEDAQNAVVRGLLERLNAVDRADAQTALEQIDTILEEEREREKRDSLSHISEQQDGTDGSEASLELGALAPSRRSLLEPELSLNLTDLQQQQQQPDAPASMPEQRRMSRPPVSDAVDNQGNTRPGAYSSPGRAYGQRPLWGRGSENNNRRFSLGGRFRGLGNSFRNLTNSAHQAQPSVQAVLVEEDAKQSEEQIRDRVTQEVRQELVSEMISDSVSAVPVDPNEAKRRNRRIAIGLGLIALLVAAVIGLSVGLTTANSNNNSSQQSISPLDVIATVPETICYDRFPGQGHSLGVLCERNDTIPQGGGVANVVCKAWLDQMETADLCITNSGACRADFAAGEYRRKDPVIMLPFNNTMEILEMTGEQVVQALNDGIRFALDPLFGTTGAYPYGHAIRYDVDATMRMISNIWVNPRMKNDEWSQIEPDRVYRVVTHSFLAGGGDNYCTMKSIPDEKRNRTGMPWDQVLLEYAIASGVIEDLPTSEYSTQNYTRPPDGDREICFE